MCIAKINIDKAKPIIKLHSVENVGNKITVYIKITEKVNFDLKHLENKAGENKVTPIGFEVYEIQNNNEKIYKIEIDGIKQKGIINITFKKNSVIDSKNLTNDITNVNTGIELQNKVTTTIYEIQKVK